MLNAASEEHTCIPSRLTDQWRKRLSTWVSVLFVDSLSTSLPYSASFLPSHRTHLPYICENTSRTKGRPHQSKLGITKANAENPESDMCSIQCNSPCMPTYSIDLNHICLPLLCCLLPGSIGTSLLLQCLHVRDLLRCRPLPLPIRLRTTVRLLLARLLLPLHLR